MIAEEVVVQLQAKIDQYKRGLAEAESTFNRSAGQIESRSKTLSERVRVHFGALTLYSAAALAAIPVALAKVIDKSFEFAASLKEQAEQVGVTTQQLQEYRYAGSQVGLTTEQVDKALQFLNRSFGQAEQGAKKPIKALHDLGFSVQDINRIIQGGAANGFAEIADRIAKIPDPARRAADTIGLLGRSGQAAMPLLLEGAAGINALREAAREAGAVLDDSYIDRLHQAEIRYKEFKNVLSVRIAQAVADNSGAILGLVNTLIKLVNVLSRVPALWDAAMAKIAKADLPLEQMLLRVNRFAGGKPGEAYDDFLTGNIKADQQRIAKVPFEIPGARKVRLRLPQAGEESPTGGQDYSGAINKALARPKGPKGEDPLTTLKRFLEEQSTLIQKDNEAWANIVGGDEAQLQAKLKNSREQEKLDLAKVEDDKSYNAQQKKDLEHQIRVTAADERRALIKEHERKVLDDTFSLEEQYLKNQEAILQAQEQLTTDRKQRAVIEKKLLDLALTEQRLAAQKVLADENASPQDKAGAQSVLDSLPILKALGYANINQQNASPGQKYLQELNDGLRDVSDTLQTMEVDQLKKLDDFLSGAVAHALGLSGALGDVVTQLMRIGLERELIQPLANILFGGASASNAGGIFSLFSKLLGGGSATPDLSSIYPSDLNFLVPHASGGPVTAGQGYLVGEHGPEPFFPSTNGVILPNQSLGQQSVVEVHIIANEYFDARVGRVTGPALARVAVQAAHGGSKLAQIELTRQAIHTLG
jgi:hypothetical protein